MLRKTWRAVSHLCTKPNREYVMHTFVNTLLGVRFFFICLTNN